MPTAKSKSPSSPPVSRAAATKPGPETPRFEPPVYQRDGALPIADLIETEWVLTNGLGGFSMGTALGVPTRRYHGLLVAATTPPVGRIVALAHAAERLVLDPGGAGESVMELATFEFNAGAPTLHPGGHRALASFRKGLDVRFEYAGPGGPKGAGGGARVVKTVHLHQGTNAVTVSYGVTLPPRTAARLEVRPLVAMRDFHHLRRRGDFDRFGTRVEEGGAAAAVSLDGRELTLAAEARSGRFVADPQWWYDFFYRTDASRGQECSEDLFCPGVFLFELPRANGKETTVSIQAGIGPAEPAAPAKDLAERTARLTAHYAAATGNGGAGAAADARAIGALVAAADDFVVAKAIPGAGRAGSASGTTIIAGYPWFSDWGRDTLICLRGLLLTTGRLDQARDTLVGFARHRRAGIIPNVFNEGGGGGAEYNTVDASLWFLQAACDYREAAGSAGEAAWRDDLLPACLDIIDHYRRGTEFNIAEDPMDRLITAGTEGTQLTWMDAKRDGVVFTPRHGKCVEINALWHSGLRRVAATLAGERSTVGADLTDLAEAVARSFRSSFWNERRRCLFDRLAPTTGSAGEGWTPAEELRPNQIFAVSLPHSPLPPDQQRAVVEAVRDRLLTPVGLRTLDPADGRYRGRYHGTLFERDGAYHNGTAWPFLLGAFAEAVLRAGGFSDAAKREAREVLAPLVAELDRRGGAGGGSPGQIAEVYDGDDTQQQPRRPSGCPAQAWSVAEPLRVLAMMK